MHRSPTPRGGIATVPAKINIGLAVGPRRDDGFHDLETVFAAIDVYETVTVTETETTSLVLTGPETADLPVDETNLAWRAARQLGVTASIVVDKQIPVAAGLAGGSADAAGVLLGCGEFSSAALLHAAADLGSDVAFALTGGVAIGRGRGEQLETLDSPPLHWVLAAAEGGLSTPAVYAELDRIRPDAPPPVLDPQLLVAVRDGDPQRLAPLLHNDLQAASINLVPALADTLDAGVKAGALAGMVSGSGPSCLFLVADRPQAEALAAELAPHCRWARPVISGVRTQFQPHARKES